MLKMGCVKVDITPKMPVFLRGYGARNAMSDCIEERLEAGVMILQQGRKKQLLLTVDSLGFDTCECARIYADLKAATGFDGNSTYICCSHTHFAPGLSDYFVTFPKGDIKIGKYPPEKGYYPFLMKRIIDGIKKAEEAMEEVELEETMVDVSNISFNRRPIVKETGLVETNYTWPRKDIEKYQFQKYDTQFNVWRFRGKDDKIKGIIGRFSCHPVTGGNEFYGVSADYPGYFQKYVQEYFGCPGLFIQGSAGDVVPLRRNGESRKDLGLTLATAIRLAELKFVKVPDFKLETNLVQVPLKLRVKCSRDNADALLEKGIKDASAKKEYDEKFGWLTYKYEFTKMYPSDNVSMPMHIMRLGTKVLVGMPFEVLTSIGLGLRKACPNAVLTSITGGYDGYLPMAREYRQGGYEATWGPRFNKTAGNEMLAAAIEAVKSMK